MTNAAIHQDTPSPCRQLSPAIDQPRLEAIQWLAFGFMLVDHIGVFFLDHNAIMRSIGRLAFPLFALVFSWRLSDVINRSPTLGLLLMGKRLLICGILSEGIFWLMTEGDQPWNIIFTFLLALAIIALTLENRPIFVPSPHVAAHETLKSNWIFRILVAAAFFYFLPTKVDYNHGGVLLIVCLFAYFRWGRPEAIIGAIWSLAVISYDNIFPYAILSAPVAIWLLRIRSEQFRMQKLHPMTFYWLYPAHLFIILIAITTISANTVTT